MDILKPLNDLAPGVNPYQAFSDILAKQVNDSSQTPQSFYRNINAITALYSCTIVVSLYYLLLQRANKSLWFFRMQSTSHGQLVIPNSNSMISFWSLLTAIAAIVTINLQAQSTKETITPSSCIAFLSLWSIPLLFAIWSEAYAMGAAVLLSKPIYNIYGFQINAIYLNIFFLSHYPLHIVVAAILAGISASKFVNFYAGYHSFQKSITSAISSWDGHSSFQLQLNWIGPLQNMATDMEQALKSLRAAFRAQLVLHLSVAAVYLPAALLYILALRKALGNTRKVGRYGLSSSTDRMQLSTLMHRIHSLNRSYLLMIFETLLVFGVSFGFYGIILWTTIDLEHIYSDVHLRETNFLVVFYLFALLGIPINCLICWRSWSQSSVRVKQELGQENYEAVSLMNAIQITSEQVVHIESDFELKKTQHALTFTNTQAQDRTGSIKSLSMNDI